MTEAAMPWYFCPQCGGKTQHFNVSRSAQIAEVTRQTVYAWMRRGLVHGKIRPSGMKFICVNSLAGPVCVALPAATSDETAGLTLSKPGGPS
jgi:hypothetical protein